MIIFFLFPPIAGQAGHQELFQPFFSILANQLYLQRQDTTQCLLTEYDLPDPHAQR